MVSGGMGLACRDVLSGIERYCEVLIGVERYCEVLRHWSSHSIKWTPAGLCCLGQREIRCPTNLKPTGAKRHARSSTHVNP